MKIIFMGTPDFSVPCLDALLDAGHEILAVFTQPDKPKGRGYALTPPPVKIRAQERNIIVYQPQSLRSGDVEKIIESLSPDVIVVVAYGKILPKQILDLPPFGCVNVHASLLPKYRGAAPIQWAIVNGETESGVTTMQMNEGLDTGDMLESESISIGEYETAQSLHDRLSALGAKLICSTLDRLHEIAPTPQNDSDFNYAPMIKKEMAQINFSRPATEIHNLIRGFNPWPAAYTTLLGKRLKVFSSLVSGKVKGEPGAVIETDGKLIVCCGMNTALELCEVQIEGSRRMIATDMLRGKSVLIGTRLGE